MSIKTETKYCLRKGQIIAVKNVPEIIPFGVCISINRVHRNFWDRIFCRPKWKYSTSLENTIQAIVLGEYILNNYSDIILELQNIFVTLPSQSEKDVYKRIAGINFTNISQSKKITSSGKKRFTIEIPKIEEKHDGKRK